MNSDGFVYYRDRVCVPNDDELKKFILEEAHSVSFSMHPGSTKMYPNLIQETEEKVKVIRERLKVATDKQKSYTNIRRKDIRYEIGEKDVFESIALEEGNEAWRKRQVEP